MLNDPDELRYGVNRIREWHESNGHGLSGSEAVREAVRSVLDDLDESILSNPAYVVCASTDEDSLSQWRGYAGAGGYAIELDTSDEYMISHRPDPASGFFLGPT